MEERDRFVDKYELTASLVFFLLGVMLLVYIIPDQISGRGDIPNARTLPYTFAVLICILSLLWAAQAFSSDKVHDGVRIIKGFGIGLLLLVLGVLIEVVGYPLAGCVAIVCVALMIHRGRLLYLVIFSVCVTLLYYIFFWKLLYISFPKGWFFA
jgi:hypothetical protein